jgi:hypothetical protein
MLFVIFTLCRRHVMMRACWSLRVFIDEVGRNVRELLLKRKSYVRLGEEASHNGSMKTRAGRFSSVPLIACKVQFTH